MRTMEQKQEATDTIMRYLNGIDRMRKYWGSKTGYLATYRGLTTTGYTRAEAAMFDRYVREA